MDSSDEKSQAENEYRYFGGDGEREEGERGRRESGVGTSGNRRADARTDDLVDASGVGTRPRHRAVVGVTR